MTVKEAKEFLIDFEKRLCDEGFGVFVEENEEYCTKLFDVITFAIKNLVPDIEDYKEKCKTDCPFITSEYRELCKELTPSQNCYQCIVIDYQIMKQNYDNISKLSNKYFSELQDIKEANKELKARLYDLMNGEKTCQ